MSNVSNPNGPTQRPTEGNRPGGVSGNVAERAQEDAQRLRDSAIQKVEETGEQARKSMEQGRTQLAERIRRLGSALRSSSESLKDKDQLVARYTERASDGFERAAKYVSSADLRDIVRDAEEFARRRPAVFFGGAFLIGLAAGRFLKSSARERESDRERYTTSGRSMPQDDLEGVFDVEASSRPTPPGGFGSYPTHGTGGFEESQGSGIGTPGRTGPGIPPRRS